jgi:hypothetical protein
MWSKYVTRRLATQIAQAWNFGWGEPMQKVYGVSLMNTLVFRDEKKTEYYVDQKQHEIYIQGLYKLLLNEKFLRTFHKDAQARLENILSEFQTEFNKDLTKLSNQQLLLIFKNFLIPRLSQFYIRMWTVFNLGEPLANTVRAYLEKHFTDQKKIDEYLLSLSSPMVPNDVLNERIDLLS